MKICCCPEEGPLQKAKFGGPWHQKFENPRSFCACLEVAWLSTYQNNVLYLSVCPISSS